jgi:hypothetical protein
MLQLMTYMMMHEKKEQDHIMPNALPARCTLALAAAVSAVAASRFAAATQKHSRFASRLSSWRVKVATSSRYTNVGTSSDPLAFGVIIGGAFPIHPRMKSGEEV